MNRALRVLGALLLLLAAFAARAGDLEVWFLDVGQGDAAFIRTPSGKTVLVDAGPPESERVVESFLRDRLKAPLDVAVMSHPHADHMGGMLAALRVRGVRDFYDPVVEHPSPLLTRLYDWLDHAERTGKTVAHRVRAGRTKPVDFGDGVRIEFLAPEEPLLVRTRSDVNANSIVFRLTYGETAFLFPGDAEAETESRLVHDFPRQLRATVLKVPHHGSRYTSHRELLELVQPKYAVVSCGKNNDYGHPHAEALARLAAAGAKIFRTDEDGTVYMTSNGRAVSVETKGRALAREAAGTAGPAPPAEPDGYVGSIRTRYFHRASCPKAELIKPANRVRFATRAAALADGRVPARDCNP